MASAPNKIIGLLKKTTRFFLYSVLALFILANLFIILSGRFYIYKGIRHTYLAGQSGPSIYELDIFAHSTLAKSDSTIQWIPSSNFNKNQPSALDLNFMNDLDTRAFLVFKGDSIVFEKYLIAPS